MLLAALCGGLGLALILQSRGEELAAGPLGDWLDRSSMAALRPASRGPRATPRPVIWPALGLATPLAPGDPVGGGGSDSLSGAAQAAASPHPAPLALGTSQAAPGAPAAAAAQAIPTGAPAAPAVLAPAAPPGAGEALPRLRQLTVDGCCPGAWWSGAGDALHFIDRGAGGAGIYGLSIWPPGGQPTMVDTELAMLADGTRYHIRPAGTQSLVRELDTGREWLLPTGGNPLRLSPDGTRVVWWEARGGRDHHDSLSRIYTAGIDGADPRELGGLYGTEVIGFLPGGGEVLVLGRTERDRPTDVLLALELGTGAMRELARGAWLSDVLLAPSGQWVAYLVSLDRSQPEANGVWIAPTGPGAGAARRLDRFGAFRWRGEDRLLLVPMEPGAASHSLWEYEAAGAAGRPLFDPAEVAFRIAGNDWSVSPDGRHLAFMAEEDRNLWLLELP